MALFEVKDVDREFYRERLKDFLPDRIIDFHTHVWLDSFRTAEAAMPVRTVSWPSLVAKDNSIEDLVETYRLMFPDKTVTPMIFSNLSLGDDIDAANGYIVECSRKYNYPSLIFTLPQWSAEELETRMLEGGFKGCKVYLSMSAPYIPEKEIRIFDFLPHRHLEVLNRHGRIVILHIPRDGRLKDMVNLSQMLEIEEKYPNVRLVIAHVGRAYCDEDIGNAFDILSGTRNMMFDISANTNSYVFERLIEAVGPKRIIFGSDLPILRMRTRRICENETYINLVPQGLYGSAQKDRHLREVGAQEASGLTFFLYEEIDAFRRGAGAAGLKRQDIEDVFYNNAARLLEL